MIDELEQHLLRTVQVEDQDTYERLQTTPGIVRMAGSVGNFSWPGASGTNWWADPKEDMVVVFMAASPGPIRWHYRQVIDAMVNRAIMD